MQVSNTGSVSNAKNTPFDKYRKSGSYHWAVLSHNPFARNLIHLGRYQVTQSLLESAVYGVAGKSVLDMGCGDGVLSYRITRAGGIVSGIDLCEYAIEYAKKQAILRRVHIDFSIQDVCATKFPDGTFDAVVSNEVIEHLSEPGKMLLEIKRVLRPGGIAVLSTPIRVTKKPLDPYHVNEWFREDFCDLVELVFPDVEYRVSHPIALTDVWYRTKLGRRVLQIISVFSNPMCYESSTGLFRQQYAIVRSSRS